MLGLPSPFTLTKGSRGGQGLQHRLEGHAWVLVKKPYHLLQIPNLN